MLDFIIDYDIQYVQLYRQTYKEKLKEIKEDPQYLKRLGVEVYSVTCDGHSAILKAVANVYPNAVIRRCLVHIKRQLQNYLSRKPKLELARELLNMSQKITYFRSIVQIKLANQKKFTPHSLLLRKEVFIKTIVVFSFKTSRIR